MGFIPLQLMQILRVS